MIGKKIANLYDIVFSILLFSLSLSFAAPNILLIILFILFIINKNKVVLSNSYIKLVLIFVSFLVVKALFNNAFIENFYFYKNLLLVLVLTVFSINLKNITLAAKGYILGVFLAIIISFYKIFSFYFYNNKLPLGNTSEVQNLILIHRPYFGFMCLMAIVLIDYLRNKISNQSEKIVYIIITVLVTIYLYLIVARLALFLLIIYLLIKTFIYLKRFKAYSILGLSIFSIVIIVFFTQNENLKNRLHIKSSYKETIKVLKNQEPRFVIWDCVSNQITNKQFNTFLGYKNRKKIQQNLNNCFEATIENTSKRDYYLETKFNTHNQFFDIFLNGGIIASMLFMSIFIFIGFIFRNNFNAFFILVAFLCFLSIENLFYRQYGAYLFGIFIPLFYNILKEENGN